MDVTAVLATSAGSWAVWQPESFLAVHDYSTWSAALEDDDDRRRWVGAGALVPISLGFDGAFRFDVRTGDAATAVLSPRERAYHVVGSEPYLLISHGSACISGVEAVGADGGLPDVLRLALPAGRWAATVHMIAWDDEPGSRDRRGRPTSRALADVVVLLNRERDGTTHYRRSPETFDRSDA